jgi:putative Ca2+/H+ antiporter (TMEM165/GDT1 family)
MDVKLFLAVFASVFLAEIGDKSQLATMLFATRQSVSLITIFFGASLALVTSTGLAVIGGALISQYVDPRYLSYAAGAGFIFIGIWTILRV